MAEPYFELISPMALVHEALLLTPDREGLKAEAHGRYGIAVLGHVAAQNIDTAAAPHLQDAASKDQRLLMQYEIDSIKDTLRFGLDDIETVFGIAERTMAENGLLRDQYGKVLHESGRLVVAVSGMGNDEVDQLFAQIPRREPKGFGTVTAEMLKMPMDIVTNQHRTYLSWNSGITEWINLSEAAGCPARKAVVTSKNNQKDTLMNELWHMAVDAEYPKAVGA